MGTPPKPQSNRPASARSASKPAASTALARRDDSSLALPTRQQALLDALAKGKDFTEAARLAGVNRQTFYNWRRGDPRFVAAFNAWQNDNVAVAQSRLAGGAGLAATTLLDAIAAGNVPAALELLRRLGLLVPVKSASEDPLQVQRDQALRQREFDNDILHRENRVKDAEMMEGLIRQPNAGKS